MYKLKPDDFVLNTETGAYFNKDSWLWEEYELWLGAGNTPEPEFTRAELIQKKILAIRGEKERRIDAILGNAREKQNRVRLILSYKDKVDSGDIVSPEEGLEKDAEISKIRDAEQVEHAASDIISWVNDPIRTIAELKEFDETSW
jgi:hypothetical protein